MYIKKGRRLRKIFREYLNIVIFITMDKKAEKKVYIRI